MRLVCLNSSMVAPSPVEVGPPPELIEPQRPPYERSPVLLFRLLVAGVAVLAGMVLTAAASETLLDLDARVLELFGGLPDSFERFLVGLSQFVALLLPAIVTIALLALRQVRTLVVAAVGAGIAAAALALIDGVIDAPRPPALVSVITGDTWILGAAFPSAAYLAGGAAVATILAVFIGRRWGRLAWAALLVVALFRLLASATVPAHLLLALGVGWFVGTAVVLAFGAPDHAPTARMVADALGVDGPSAGAAGSGVRRRPRIDTVVRHDDGRHRAVREDARPGRARRRPALPRLPLLPPEERGRSAALLVAAPRRRARGPGGAEGPGLRRADTAGPQRGHGRAGRHAAGLRGHRRSFHRLDRR